MENKRESILKGIISLLISQVFIKIIGLIYKLYLTNREGFGDAGNAIYASGYQIYALLLSISSIGVPNAVSKLVAERLSLGDTKGAHRIFKIAFATFGVIGLVGTLLLLCGAGTFANMMGIPEAEMTLVALSPSIFFVSITSAVTKIITIDTSDLLLSCLIIGISLGISNGFMYKVGFSNGGINIISQIFYKYFKIPLSNTTLIINMIIVVLGGVYFTFTKVLYASFILIISKIVMDKILRKDKCLCIITN